MQGGRTAERQRQRYTHVYKLSRNADLQICTTVVKTLCGSGSPDDRHALFEAKTNTRQLLPLSLKAPSNLRQRFPRFVSSPPSVAVFSRCPHCTMHGEIALGDRSGNVDDRQHVPRLRPVDRSSHWITDDGRPSAESAVSQRVMTVAETPKLFSYKDH